MTSAPIAADARPRARWLSLAAAGALAFVVVGQAQAQNAPPRVEATWEQVLEAKLTAASLDLDRRHDVSPDGRWLVYSTAKADLESGLVTTELRARLLDGRGPERILARQVSPRKASWFTPRISPDSRLVAYVDPARPARVELVELSTGEHQSVAPDLKTTPATRFSELRWGPESRRLGVLVTEPVESPELQTGVSVSREWTHHLGLTPSPTSRLYIVNIGDGHTVAASPVDFLVADFDLSADPAVVALAGREPAAVGQGGTGDGQRLTSVRLYNPSTGALRTIAEAYSSEPRFSPDGRRLAFYSPIGGDVYLGSQIGLYDLASGRLDRFGDAWERGLKDAQWIDSRTLAGWSAEGLGCGVRYVDVEARTTRLAQTPGLTCDRSLAVARKARKVVFVRDRFDTASDLWSSSVERWRPRQATDLNPELNARLKAAMTMRELTWPSGDGRFIIHGALLTPPGPARPRPLIVSVLGGPGLVNALTGGDDAGQFLNQVSLAAGYAVLIPATRGRGGFGRTFDQAIRDHRDYSEGPLSDVLPGVDLVESIGEADPSRIAWNGFSYGASLGAYAIGHTRIFRAALLADPGEQDYLNNALRRVASYGNHLDRVLTGVADPYVAADADRLRSFSGLSELHQAQTPTMLHCGALSGSVAQGCLLIFQGLQHFDVPSEMVVFPRTGHGIGEPLLKLDAERRRIGWLDRWLSTPKATP